MLQKTFDNETTGRTQTYEWWKRVKTAEIRSKILHVSDDNLRNQMKNI